MLCLTIRTRVRFVLLAAGAAALVWIMLLALLPHLGIRDRVAERLERRLGQHVSLAQVRLTWLGAARLTDLHIGDTARPWLIASEVEVDLSWTDLLLGRSALRSIEAHHVTLNLVRFPDGSLNALPNHSYPRTPRTPSPRNSDNSNDSSISLNLHNATLTFLDESTQTHLRLTNLEAAAEWSEKSIAIEQLHAVFNGGALNLAARLDHTPGQVIASGELRIDDAEIDPALGALAYIIPTGDPSGLTTARLDLRMRLQAESDSLEGLAANLKGAGRVVVREIEPAPGSLIAALASRVNQRGQSGQASIAGSFTVDPKGVSTTDTHLRIGSFPIAFNGRTSFEGRLDYLIRAEGLAATIDQYGARLPDRARRVLRELDLPKKLESVADLRLSGHAGAPTLSIVGANGLRGTLLDPATLERLAESLQTPAPIRR